MGFRASTVAMILGKGGGLPTYDYHSDSDLLLALGSDNEGYFTKDGGELVSRWWDERFGDDSGTYLLQDTGANQGLHDADGVQFNTSDEMLPSANLVLGTAYSMIWAIKMDTGALQWDWYNINASNHMVIRTTEIFRHRLNGANDDDPTTLTVGGNFIIQLRRNGTDMNTRVNGGAWTNHVVDAAAFPTMTTADQILTQGDGRHVKGSLLFNGEVSEANMESYATILNDRYSIY